MISRHTHLSSHLEAEILAAAQELRVPGSGLRRILPVTTIERLAGFSGTPRWKVEALALELNVAPLHYLRNLAQFGADGQARLLRASVSLVGRGAVLERALDRLAVNGVGRLSVLVPLHRPDDAFEEGRTAERLAAIPRNRNGSCEARAGTLWLKGGDPAAAVQGADAAAACLDDSMDEQLLQFACRMAKTPLVLAGAQAGRGQATTVFPGDAGVSLVYRPTHPHLEPKRAGARMDPKAALMVGAWIAEQVTGVLLGRGDLLRGRLLYADLETEEMSEHPL
jgi:molybdopterin/thiamine biosynthesis adenylyltransferase